MGEILTSQLLEEKILPASRCKNWCIYQNLAGPLKPRVPVVLGLLAEWGTLIFQSLIHECFKLWSMKVHYRELTYSPFCVMFRGIGFLFHHVKPSHFTNEPAYFCVVEHRTNSAMEKSVLTSKTLALMFFHLLGGFFWNLLDFCLSPLWRAEADSLTIDQSLLLMDT